MYYLKGFMVILSLLPLLPSAKKVPGESAVLSPWIFASWILHNKYLWSYEHQFQFLYKLVVVSMVNDLSPHNEFSLVVLWLLFCCNNQHF